MLKMCFISLQSTLDNIFCFHGLYFQEEKREEVKEWVLAVSMDQKVWNLLYAVYNTTAAFLLRHRSCIKSENCRTRIPYKLLF